MKKIIQGSILLFFTFLTISCGNNNRPDFYVYKILTPVEWQQSQGKANVQLSAIDKGEAFIHLAEAKNYEEIARRFSGDATEAIILKLNPNKLVGRLVKQTNPGDPTEYYHLYDGRIPLNSVVSVRVLKL
jgi:uncharacterized protein (DUF952 family)